MPTVPVQLAGFPSVALLSVNTIAGQVEAGSTAGVSARKRLFDSPVKPSRTQVAEMLLAPAFTLVLTTSVDPALKLAWERQQSPTTFHSAVFQPCAKLSTLVGVVIIAATLPAVVSTTVSESAAAVPVSVVPCSSSAGTMGAGLELLLSMQSSCHCVHPAGHPDPKSRSQYSMNTQGPLHWFWLKTNCCQPRQFAWPWHAGVGKNCVLSWSENALARCSVSAVSGVCC